MSLIATSRQNDMGASIGEPDIVRRLKIGDNVRWTLGPENAKVIADYIRRLESDLHDYKQLMDSIWRADIRAAEAWRQETGKSLVWPDKVALLQFLIDKLDKAGMELPVSNEKDT